MKHLHCHLGQGGLGFVESRCLAAVRAGGKPKVGGFFFPLVRFRSRPVEM